MPIYILINIYFTAKSHVCQINADAVLRKCTFIHSIPSGVTFFSKYRQKHVSVKFFHIFEGNILTIRVQKTKIIFNNSNKIAEKV